MICPDKREQILKLLREGKAESADIAHKTGVPIRTVAAIKAHLKMGHYSTASRRGTAYTTSGTEPKWEDAGEKVGSIEWHLRHAKVVSMEPLRGSRAGSKAKGAKRTGE
jgi:hypothetical protein